jgi:Ca-activated chloride channel family protein
VIPIGVKDTFLRNIDPLRYQHKKTELGGAVGKTEIMNIKLRYKMPDGDESKLIEHPVIDQQLAINSTSDNFRFAASVAEFGMMLRSSAFRSQSSYSNILRLANSAKGKDEEGYRVEMIKMVRKAEGLVGEVVDNE